MFFLSQFSDLRLDIVGIVAILGEASVSRIAQVSALSWFHVLPRLMPAPQALLKHRLDTRLPTELGTIVGIYSGNLSNEHNFFCQLLHPKEPQKYEVQLLTVTKDPKANVNHHYDVSTFNGLLLLSLLGLALTITLITLAAVLNDGWALIGTLLLSITSTFVGAASKWRLNLKVPERKPLNNIPDSDLVLFYPGQSAFRIVRCDEYTARLYFTAETVEPLLPNKTYRLIALISSVTLIFGLICIGNAQQILQISFAGAYVILNIAYWLASALEPSHHWKHSYKVKEDSFTLPEPQIKSQAQSGKPGDLEANRSEAKPRIFTTALWEAIALTGSSTWMSRIRAVPKTPTWEAWLRSAGEASRTGDGANHSATQLLRVSGQSKVILSNWPYRAKLSELMNQAVPETARRPAWSEKQLENSSITPSTFK